MVEESEIFNSELPYVAPASKEEVRGNEHYMASTLAVASRKKMRMQFCVLFLIHYCIEPDVGDYGNIEMFFLFDPYVSWKLAYQKDALPIPKNILGMKLCIPIKNENNERFNLLEAYYECVFNEKTIEVFIPLSKINTVNLKK